MFVRRQDQSMFVVYRLVLKDGSREEIRTELLKGPALDDLLGRLAKRGIPVQDARGGR